MSAVAVLGASGTIGGAVARKLVQRGRRVLLVGRNAEKLAPLGAELASPTAVVDSQSSQSLEAALAEHSESLGGFSGLVNGIGSLLLKPAHATSDDEFRQTIETNLFTSFALVKAGGRLLRDHGGSIVLFSSAAADIGIQNHEAIAAAKAGIVGLARSAAATYAPNNVRVNVVSPGLVRTELTRRIWDNTAAAGASRELHALGRFGEPEQIASLVAWLLDPANDWITGQVIGLDGGLSRVLPKRRPVGN